MKLVYAAPVPYASFAQRPHHFVAALGQRCGGPVFWIDPYPSRLPRLSDLRRAPLAVYKPSDAAVQVASPPRWGAEPLMGAVSLRRLAWRRLLARIAAFAQGAEWMLAIGRPSRLALRLLKEHRPQLSCYDAMDDFPAFLQGRTRALGSQLEAAVASGVDVLLVSSTALRRKFADRGLQTELLPNGLDDRWLAVSGQPRPPPSPPVLGYLGAIGPWFDWALVIKMAYALPQVRLQLVGPLLDRPRASLPPNVHLLGECAASEVPEQLQGWTAGLIPFKVNRLTASVDPIKYYEYRAAGLPILSTRFGEMRSRGVEQGVYLLGQEANFAALLDAVAARPSAADVDLARFREANAWRTRFAQSRFFCTISAS